MTLHCTRIETTMKMGHYRNHVIRRPAVFESLIVWTSLWVQISWRLMTKWLLDWREAQYGPDFSVVTYNGHTTGLWHACACRAEVTSVRNLSKFSGSVVRLSCNRSAIHAPSTFGSNYAGSLCDICTSQCHSKWKIYVFKQFRVFPTVAAKRTVHRPPQHHLQ